MNEQPKAPVPVWWVIWFAMTSGIPIFYVFLGASKSSTPAESPFWFAGVAPLFVSVFIRWIVLPRMQKAAAALPLFMVGLAMAEATCFFGLFIFPAHKQELFILSLLGMLQFAPYFAKRYS